MSYPLVEIDDINRGDHFYLNEDDGCYYFMTYTSRQSYSFSDANNYITNLKIKPSVETSNPGRWKYKLKAINDGALFLRNAVENFGNFTFIPMPPSKIKTNPEFDDRMHQVLLNAFHGDADVKELITFKKDMEPSHSLLPGERHSPNDLKRNMNISQNICTETRRNIIILDDVLTTGAHFKACKELILDMCPKKNVMGLFMARRGFLEI